ncbi:MAG: hypothetical protein KDJ77_13410 [Rhodobiaceae bacterium]|nr:hypothetical protein [Rhodobiaceae bacterium]
MFTPTRPYIFHIELTDTCNAGCPMCARTQALNFCKEDPAVVRGAELTLADFQTHFTDDLCARTSQVVLSGNYGDPLAARDALAICDHLTARGVRVAISTNASLRTPKWWTKLGAAMKRTGSRVEFHIDGLADTNALYRVNTSFDKIMENAAAYIATGATAEWHFILFRHNEHQVEEARALSKAMGFAQFILIDTIRFAEGGFPFQMPDGTRFTLEASTKSGADFSDLAASAPRNEQDAARRETLGAHAALSGGSGIRCKSAADNRPYISATGQVSACCWVVDSPEEAGLYTDNGLDPDRNNIRNRPLEEILGDEPFAGLYAQGWNADTLAICRRKCGEMKRNVRSFL